MSQHDDLLTSAETAALLSIKTNTLEIWRNKGKGPAFIKMGETLLIKMLAACTPPVSPRCEPPR